MRFISLVLILLFLQSCGTFSSKPASRYDLYLAEEYMGRASDFSYSNMAGWNSVKMQEKAKEAAHGKNVLPYVPDPNLIESVDLVEQMNLKRNMFLDLLREYPIDLKLDNPGLTAYTQASLDCWILGNSYDVDLSFDTDMCKRSFLDGLQKLIKITKNHVEFRDFADDINSIYFRSKSDALTEDSIYRLNKIIKNLNKAQNATLMLYGYTDRVGSTSYNSALAQERITSVKNYLIDSGVLTKNNIYIKEVILGEHDPMISPQTINNNPHSRRVDIFVVK